MKYLKLHIGNLPSHRGLLQDLACTPLTQAELTERYGFTFERVPDALSMTEVSFIAARHGRLFAIVCRRDIPEWTNAIRTDVSDESLATYVPRMLSEFCESTGFVDSDLDRIWDW